MFKAYFDESGWHNESKVLAIGCLVASSQQWGRFEGKWARLLRRYKVKTFHATDLESCQGEFCGWSQSKKAAFQSELMGIMKHHLLLGVTHALLKDDWNKVVAPLYDDQRKNLQDPYLILLQCCLEDMVRYVRLPAHEQIDCVVEENNYMAARAGEYFATLKRVKGWPDYFGTLTFAKKAKVLALQSADLLAYEWYKHVVNSYTQLPHRPMRKSLKNLRSSKGLALSQAWANEKSLKIAVKEALDAYSSHSEAHA